MREVSSVGHEPTRHSQKREFRNTLARILFFKRNGSRITRALILEAQLAVFLCCVVKGYMVVCSGVLGGEVACSNLEE
jgi:hypothetical protein